MQNGKHGQRSMISDWWDKPYRKWMRRLFWKRERREQGAALPERLADDYTIDEFMADICTSDQPCDLCKMAARSEPPNV